VTAVKPRQTLINLFRWLFAAAVVASFVWFARGLEVRELLRSLRGAALAPIAAAALLNFAHMAWKAWRWRIMLAPTRRIPFLRLYRYTIVNYAASTILPARTGELVRVVLLRQREGISAVTISAVALADKVFDLGAMLLMVAPIPYLIPDLPDWVVRGIQIVTIGAIAAFAAGWGLLWWIDTHDAAPPWMERFAGGLGIWRRPSQLVLALIVSLGGWLCDAAEIMLIVSALAIPVGWPAALLVLLTLNIAIAVPSTPGSVGAFEIGAVVALQLLGVPREASLAFALIYHAVQVVPLAFIGLAELPLIWKLRAEQRPQLGV
jgi:uncharacterized membrane protein YbhN (UPF0104 family)